MPRRLLLVSTSTTHGTGYLDHCAEAIQDLLEDRTSVLFVPNARPSGVSHDEYTARARERFEAMGRTLRGIHEASSPLTAVRAAEAIFIGGGNTFVLLRGLYEMGVIGAICERVAEGMPYVGTSAGANVACPTLGTSNDMPVVEPPHFAALGLVPFNINPHYLDPDPGSTHMGEARATRIREFHVFNDPPVVGLREGAMLHVDGDAMTLRGTTGARLFRKGQEPDEFAPGDDMSFLL